MNEQELLKELNEIQNEMNWSSHLIHMDFDEGEFRKYITKDQAEALQKILNLFASLRWQIKLNSYKKLTVQSGEPIRQAECGTPVKIRLVQANEKDGDKTYFGILLGDVPLEIIHSIDVNGNLTASRSHYNPAIYIPELKQIRYGVESWWSEIETEEELSRFITDETISEIWYVKLLRGITGK